MPSRQAGKTETANLSALISRTGTEQGISNPVAGIPASMISLKIMSNRKRTRYRISTWASQIFISTSRATISLGLWQIRPSRAPLHPAEKGSTGRASRPCFSVRSALPGMSFTRIHPQERRGGRPWPRKTMPERVLNRIRFSVRTISHCCDGSWQALCLLAMHG